MTALHHRLSIPFDEFREWSRHVKPVVSALSMDSVGMDTAEYVTTEVLSNAVDHSSGKTARSRCTTARRK